MKVFRGIAVPKHQLESTIEHIRLNGIIDQSKTRRKERSIDAVYACGDKDGALYYATKHNINKTDNAPIIIEMDVKKSSLVVDGNDFLYTAFQFSNPAKAEPILKKCFGSAILKYTNKAWSSQDQSFRIAQCDLAIQDPAVIEAHHANDLVIAGRAKTVFRSAFKVKLPILPESIIYTYSPNRFPTIPHKDISLNDIVN